MTRERHVRICEGGEVRFLSATRPICHCGSVEEARELWRALADRFAARKLVLHSEKTKIVYCKDANRRGDFPVIAFDFLGFPVSRPEDDVDERRQAHLCAQLSTRGQPEGAEAHQPGRT